MFADLGYPDAVERQAKVRLAIALNTLIDRRKLTQTAAADVLGLRQPKVWVRSRKEAGRIRVVAA